MDNWRGFETNLSFGRTTAKDIACATLYLAAEATYIIGEILEINGGSYL